MAQGTITPPEDNIDDNLIHGEGWEDFVDNHTNSDGSIKSTGRAEAGDLPVSRGGKAPLVDESGHITAADNQQPRGQQGSAGSEAAKQAIMGNDPDRGSKGPFSNRGGGSENQQGGASRAANTAKDTAELGEKGAEAAEGNPVAIAVFIKKAWDYTKEHWRGIGMVALIGMLPVIIFGFVVFYALSNPADFMWNIAKTIGYKESAILVGKGMYNWITKGSIAGMQPGEVEYRGPNTALAADSTPAPKPGSFADKVSKIDWSKAQYQTKQVNCPYSVHTKEVVNSSGTKRSVIDYIAGPDGKPATGADQNAISYCLDQRYPVLNTILRQPETRTINFQVGIHLNYATPLDQLPEGGADEQHEFFRDKTLERVQDQENQTTSDNQDVTNAIQKAEELLKQGKSPDQISFSDIGYTLPPASTPELQRANTLCAFGDVLLTPKNIGESIWSRANAARRAAYKIATISSTGKYHKVTSEENNATVSALSNWDDSYAYLNEVKGDSSTGENIDPEATHNRAVGVDQIDGNSQAIANLRQGCQDLKDNANFSWGNAFANVLSFFHIGGSTQEERDNAARTKIDEFYFTLTKQISLNSNGVFTADFFTAQATQLDGLQQVVLRMVRIGSNVTVSGVEGGPQDFNRQAMGYRQNAFDNMLAIGGRFLTDQEAATNSVVAEATQRQLDKQKGIAWRLFDTSNTRSLASNFMGIITNPPKVAIVKSLKLSFGLLNPINLFRTINDNTSYLAFGETNRAMAATDIVDQYFKLNAVGFTDAELSAYNAMDLAKEVENIKENGSEDQKAALAQYDKCFATEVTNQLFLYGDNLNKTGADKYRPDFKYAPEEIKSQLADGTIKEDGSMEDPNKPNCAELYSPEPASQGGNRQDLINKYRIYRFNLQTVNALDYLSDPNTEDPSLNANAGAGTGLGNNGQHAAGFIWPVPKAMQITQCYGKNGHPGIDINATLGMDVAAVQDGTVVRAEGEPATGGYGNLVVIEHKDKGLWTYYAHNQKMNVTKGQEVKQGDIISQADSTGHSTGNHLHFEVRTGGANGKTNNPLDYLPNDGRNLIGCTGAFGQ